MAIWGTLDLSLWVRQKPSFRQLPSDLPTHRRFVILTTSRLAVANKDDEGSRFFAMTKYRVETHSVLHVHNIDLKNLSQPQVFAHESAMFTLTQIRHFCSPNLLYTR